MWCSALLLSGSSRRSRPLNIPIDIHELNANRPLFQAFRRRQAFLAALFIFFPPTDKIRFEQADIKRVLFYSIVLLKKRVCRRIEPLDPFRF